MVRDEHDLLPQPPLIVDVLDSPLGLADALGHFQVVPLDLTGCGTAPRPADEWRIVHDADLLVTRDHHTDRVRSKPAEDTAGLAVQVERCRVLHPRAGAQEQKPW